ncbi:hypothetical protein K502DRAFT_325135 [Neoconidiobolus thromboides FSU 785]|nr:hypothetical protein K502DRAFT_325135 [Neoconidiobolus thromboides FSU 785]
MKEYRKKETIYYQVNQYYQQKSEEYVEQSIKLKEKLQLIHLLDEDLSNIGQLCLDSLVKLSILLDTKDVDIENLQLAISYHQIELFNQENEIDKIDNKLNQMEDIMKRIKFENGKLKDLKLNLETMNELIKHKTQTWKKDSFNLQLKANEYEKRVKFLKVDWENKNLDAKELRIKDLNKLKEQLIILESQLATYHSKIKIYHELPPDLKLVRYQIEEKKELLKTLLIEQEKLIEKLILF